MPFLDERADLVSGCCHAVETSVAVSVLDFFNLKLNVSPVHLWVLVQVSQVNSEDTPFQVLGETLYKQKTRIRPNKPKESDLLCPIVLLAGDTVGILFSNMVGAMMLCHYFFMKG